MEEKAMVYGQRKMLWHPKLKRMEPARWIGWFKFYSKWEFLIDGLVILGEPYKKE